MLVLQFFKSYNDKILKGKYSKLFLFCLALIIPALIVHYNISYQYYEDSILKGWDTPKIAYFSKFILEETSCRVLGVAKGAFQARGPPGGPKTPPY